MRHRAGPQVRRKEGEPRSRFHERKRLRTLLPFFSLDNANLSDAREGSGTVFANSPARPETAAGPEPREAADRQNRVTRPCAESSRIRRTPSQRCCRAERSYWKARLTKPGWAIGSAMRGRVFWIVVALAGIVAAIAIAAPFFVTPSSHPAGPAGFSSGRTSR